MRNPWKVLKAFIITSSNNYYYYLVKLIYMMTLNWHHALVFIKIWL